uniref:Secreted protein n=1 Tax=Trichogramma kaykai TaxID=54128 RepID=A0ABD2W1W0_9HYME
MAWITHSHSTHIYIYVSVCVCVHNVSRGAYHEFYGAAASEAVATSARTIRSSCVGQQQRQSNGTCSRARHVYPVASSRIESRQVFDTLGFFLVDRLEDT